MSDFLSYSELTPLLHSIARIMNTTLISAGVNQVPMREKMAFSCMIWDGVARRRNFGSYRES